MKVIDSHYIDGSWRAAESADRIQVINPTSEEVMGGVPAGTPQEVDHAAGAASSAFETWSAVPVTERVTLLRAVAAGLSERSEEAAQTLTAEIGCPLSFSRSMQAPSAAYMFLMAVDCAEQFQYKRKLTESMIIREPFGVVGAITPWNIPFLQVCGKTAMALAAGCTVVAKPSEVAPMTAILLAEVIDAIGLPPGVFNLVNGTGPVVGEAIATHPLIDFVTFTGSTRTGRRISELAASTIKRVALELGGKSACVILDDADLQAAVTSGVNDCYSNSGQMCTALTRMLIPRNRLGEAEFIAAKVTESHVVGDPSDLATTIGPLVSATQLERVRGFVDSGLAEGARLVTGGTQPPAGITRGYFTRPTVFSDVRPGMRIEQEEIFGPVLSLIPYDTEDQAIRIANDTAYGLSGAVWSGNTAHADAVARRLRTGQVSINGASPSLSTPTGGYKQSGIGRELGPIGFEEFLEIKAVS